MTNLPSHQQVASIFVVLRGDAQSLVRDIPPNSIIQVEFQKQPPWHLLCTPCQGDSPRLEKKPVRLLFPPDPFSTEYQARGSTVYSNDTTRLDCQHKNTAKRSRSPDRRTDPLAFLYKPTAKSKAGWKGGEGAKKQKNLFATKTPDRQFICFGFNNKGEGCKKKKCNFLHVCQICFGDEKTGNDPHPTYKCPRYADFMKANANAER